MVFLSISWNDLIKILEKYWYIKLAQKWSHAQLKYMNNIPITIPCHRELKEWLFNHLLKDIADDLCMTKKEVFDIIKKES
jgi:predicted RNA binding protein YcfA (HicA-like mRNA interferase family)